MFRSSFIVFAINLLGSAVSFCNQLVIAGVYGAGADLGIYLVAISFPFTLAGLISGVLGYQVVPALGRAENRGNGDSSLRGMLYAIGGTSILFAITGALLSPWLLRLMAPALHPSATALAVKVSQVAWAWLPLGVMAAVLTAGLHTRQRFTIATLLQPLPIIGTLVACLAAHGNHGVVALAWGQLAGYIMLVLGLGAALRLKPGSPSWTQTQCIIREAPLALGALLVFVISAFSDAVWGLHAGPSGVSLLGYAQRLVIAFAGIVITGATTVIFPRLSGHAAKGNTIAFRDDFDRSLRIMLECMVPVGAVLSVLALPIVQVVFVRRAFGQQEAHALGSLLHWMFLGMIPMSVMPLAFKALFAQGRTREAAGISLCGTASYFVLSGLLVGPFGLAGVGAAYVLSWWAVIILSLKALNALAGVTMHFVMHLAAVTTACTAAAWLGNTIFSQAQSHSSMLRLLILAAIAVGVGVIFCTGSLWWPGLDDIRSLARRFRS
jgi:putative peptidoglycan lipid II flippase